jgi:YHS domain-containing protein
MSLRGLTLALLVLVSLAPISADAQVNTNGGPAAIGGYDAVAYFADHAAVRGSAEHTASWRGATFWFATEAHRATFAAAPARYAPAYGGYCAYAAADGRLVRTDPQAWTIHGGRLFLNYSIEIRTRWLADQDRYIAEADRRWPELSRR